MPRENLSNLKRRNDELPISEELVKPSVHDDKDQISNNYKRTDGERESNENESKVVPDEHGISHLIQIKNPDRKKLKLERLASLNAFFADTSEPDLLYRLEKEEKEKEKEQQRENYQNTQTQDNTEEAQLDVKEVDKAI